MIAAGSLHRLAGAAIISQGGDADVSAAERGRAFIS